MRMMYSPWRQKRSHYTGSDVLNYPSEKSRDGFAEGLIREQQRVFYQTPVTALYIWPMQRVSDGRG
jgi:hypothetical protein